MQENSQAVTSLCVECGLCCDGSLFGAVELLDGENPPVESIRARKSETRFLELPCKCFDGKCSIYESRPKRCTAYLCDTAKLVKSGRLPLSRGQSRVVELREHIIMFRNLSGDQNTPAPALARRVIRDFRERRHDSSYADANRAIVVAAYRYRTLTNRYFRSRWKRRARRFLSLAATFVPVWLYRGK